jgi:hypothetical protein
MLHPIPVLRCLVVFATISLFACGTPPRSPESSSRLSQESDERETANTRSLVNVNSALETFINQRINESRAELGQVTLTSLDGGEQLARRVYEKMGQMADGSGFWFFSSFRPPVDIAPTTQVEVDLEKLLSPLENAIFRYPFASSRFSQTPNGFHAPAPVWIFDSTSDFAISPTIRLNGILIGTDKIGHMMQQGYWYFSLGLDTSVQRLLGRFLEGDPSLSDDDREVCAPFARAFCFYCEFGIFGTIPTGVISFADIHANEMGYQLYRDLARDPVNYRFRADSLNAESLNEIFTPSLGVNGVSLK